MKRARVTAYGHIVLEEATTPRPGPGEALIAVEVCGICGSDIHAFAGQHPFIQPPVVPGHELSGTTAALGDGVAGLKVGHRVTVEPSLVCGTCRHCRSGRYNICDNLRVIGCQSDGALAEYLSVPADRVVLLPDDLTFEQGALVEPAAVAVHAVCRANVTQSERIAIIGAGTIGLMTLQVARAMGAREIVVTDTVDERLSLAAHLGAAHVVNVKNTDLLVWMKDRYGETNPVDLCFECVGVEPAMDSAIRIAQKGARIMAVGVYPGKIAVEMAWIQDRELELIGSLMYIRDDFLKAIALIQAGQIQTAPFISRRVPLERVAEVFAGFARGPGAEVKTLIDVAPHRRRE